MVKINLGKRVVVTNLKNEFIDTWNIVFDNDKIISDPLIKIGLPISMEQSLKYFDNNSNAVSTILTNVVDPLYEAAERSIDLQTNSGTFYIQEIFNELDFMSEEELLREVAPKIAPLELYDPLSEKDKELTPRKGELFTKPIIDFEEQAEQSDQPKVTVEPAITEHQRLLRDDPLYKERWEKHDSRFQSVYADLKGAIQDLNLENKIKEEIRESYNLINKEHPSYAEYAHYASEYAAQYEEITGEAIGTTTVSGSSISSILQQESYEKELKNKKYKEAEILREISHEIIEEEKDRLIDEKALHLSNQLDSQMDNLNPQAQELINSLKKENKKLSVKLESIIHENKLELKSLREENKIIREENKLQLNSLREENKIIREENKNLSKKLESILVKINNLLEKGITPKSIKNEINKKTHEIIEVLADSENIKQQAIKQDSKIAIRKLKDENKKIRELNKKVKLEAKLAQQ
jgi:hypothetical protein